MTKGKTICLNMIVKNEAPVIRRCLESVRPIIDYWVIVDTGSTDDTPAIIRDTFKDVPGELHEHPWVDFAHNRTQALHYALHGPEGKPRGDYIFVIDADDVLHVDDGFHMPELTAAGYTVEMRYPSTVYPFLRLIRSDLPWRWVGVLHEYLTCDSATAHVPLPGLAIMVNAEGARSRDPLKFRRDALVLEKALLDDPHNARHVFYLAQSYRDAGDPELALRQYKRRVEMGGWPEEVWFSLYQIGRLKEGMGTPWQEALQDYLMAYQYRADRAEPLYRIGMHYQAKREFNPAYLFLGAAGRVPLPSGNRLFVEKPLYDYLIALELAVSCYWLGYHTEAIETNRKLLESGVLPHHLVETVTKNLQFSLDVVGA